MIRLLSLLLALILAAPVAANPQAALAAALQDAARLPPEVAAHTRYFDRTTFPAEYQAEPLAASQFLWNSLSPRQRILHLRPVGGLLWAIDLDEWKLPERVWEKLADVNVYYLESKVKYWQGGGGYAAGNYRENVAGHWLDPKAFAALRAITYSKTPIARADQAFSLASRQVDYRNKQTGVGYYDWIGVKSQADFERILKVDRKGSQDFGKLSQAIVARSGVSQQARHIARFQGLGGGVWWTFDFADPTEGGDPLKNLLLRDFEKTPHASEVYATRANGLFAYLLADERGTLQNSAPDNAVGPDDSPLRSNRDGRIHVGLSCIRCHTDGLRPINDHVRRVLRNPLRLQVADKDKFNEAVDSYFSHLDKHLERDREVFAAAVKECNGLSVVENARAVSRFYDFYAVRGRTLADCAVELGVSPVVFLRALLAGNRLGFVDLAFIAWLVDPLEEIRVEQWEPRYAGAQELLRLYRLGVHEIAIPFVTGGVGCWGCLERG